MTYAFHDIKHIVEPYLDDLPTQSKQQEYHYGHLRAIFGQCRPYNIRLNPHKCVFFVDTGCLLGFVFSKDGIGIEPLKFVIIVALPHPPISQKFKVCNGKQTFCVVLYVIL